MTANIRKELREVLKRCNREELLSIWYGFGWGPAVRETNIDKMKKAKVAMEDITDDEVVSMILERDMKHFKNR